MLKRVRWFALFGALVLVTAACDWSMVGFDAGRSGFNLFEKKITPANVGTLTETWRASPGSGTSAPVVGNGRLFVSTQPTANVPGGLSAYDAAGASCTGAAPATCSPIWSKAFVAGVPISPPLLTGDYVSADGYYIGSVEDPSTGHVLPFEGRAGGSFDPASGGVVAGEIRDGAAPAAANQGAVFGYRSELWSARIPPGFVRDYITLTHFVASLPTAQGTSFQIDGPFVDWYTPIASFVGSAPAVANGTLFILVPGGLRAYDARGVTNCSPRQADAFEPFHFLSPLNECSPMWTGTLSHPGTFDGMPAVARDRVYAPALDGAVEVFASAGCGAATCAALWTAHAGSSHIAPVSVTDDTLFAASDDGHLYAFDAAGCGAATCQPKWSANLGSAVHAPSVAGSVLFTGSEDGHIYAFDAAGCGHATCTPLWTGNVGAPVRTAPAISDGRVFVTDTAGIVHAFALA
jgi:FOG: WD40-like repeat